MKNLACLPTNSRLSLAVYRRLFASAQPEFRTEQFHAVRRSILAKLSARLRTQERSVPY